MSRTRWDGRADARGRTRSSRCTFLHSGWQTVDWRPGNIFFPCPLAGSDCQGGGRFLPPQHASWPMLGWFRGLEFVSKFHRRPASASASTLRNFRHHLQSISHPLCMHEESFPFLPSLPPQQRNIHK